jgi:hypothetical protein
MYNVDYGSSIKKSVHKKKDIDYYDLYLQQRIHIKVLQKELTTYRKYGRIIRAIKYIFVYSERFISDDIISKIKQILKENK